MGYAQDRKPGPGAYTPSIRPVVKSAPAFTMGAKRRPACEEWKPGPGMYYPRTGPSGPAFTIRGRSRADLHLEKMFLTPVRTSPDSPRPAAVRLLASSVLPGPGSYNPSLNTRGPAFTVAPKRVTKYGTESPGPGAYYVRTRPSSPSFSMADRFLTPRAVYPPPRTVYGEFCNSPGPAQYNIDRGSRQGPAFTMRGKWHQPCASGIPGPGTYYPPQCNTFGQPSCRRCSPPPRSRTPQGSSAKATPAG